VPRDNQAFRSYFVDAALQVFARGLVPGTLQSQLQAGVLVGLADEHATNLGLGIIVEAFSPTALSVLTPVVSGNVHQVTPGSVCVREDFSEVRLSQDEQR
jgi:polynucleotide 5'-kinase involved in rRNA processing